MVVAGAAGEAAGVAGVAAATVGVEAATATGAAATGAAATGAGAAGAAAVGAAAVGAAAVGAAAVGAAAVGAAAVGAADVGAAAVGAAAGAGAAGGGLAAMGEPDAMAVTLTLATPSSEKLKRTAATLADGSAIACSAASVAAAEALARARTVLRGLAADGPCSEAIDALCCGGATAMPLASNAATALLAAAAAGVATGAGCVGAGCVGAGCVGAGCVGAGCVGAGRAGCVGAGCGVSASPVCDLRKLGLRRAEWSSLYSILPLASASSRFHSASTSASVASWPTTLSALAISSLLTRPSLDLSQPRKRSVTRARLASSVIRSRCSIRSAAAASVSAAAGGASP